MAALPALGGGAARPLCRYGQPRRLARIADPRLRECSGLAASRRHPGILWAHNDSGDAPQLFALDRRGRTRAVLHVRGAAAVDWEDIAAGPGPDGRPSLYIGDIGDNGRSRTDLVVYCIPEPDLPPGQPTLVSEPALPLPFCYPKRGYNAEALAVHPATGDLYVIAKETSGASGVFRFPRPLRPRATVVLERVGAIRLPEPLLFARMITGADIAPDGRRMVVRTYSGVFELTAPAGGGFEAVFATPPRRLPTPQESQGEAVAYDQDGHGILTASEGMRAPLHLIPCLKRP